MAPVREMADNGNNPVATPEVQLELPSQTGREISRAAKQRRIEQDIKSRKSKLSKDVNTVTKMLVAYQTDFPDDDITCELQLGEAADIIRVIERASSRWITVENELDDLKSCICVSVVMSDTDTLKELDIVDAEMTKYEAKLVDVKKEKRDILKRCTDILARSKKAATRTNTITNNQTNISNTSNNTFKPQPFKPQPELKPIFLAKDCTLLEYTTFGKTFVSYMNSSQSPIPDGSVDQNIRVNLDPSWYVELQEKGLKVNTTLAELPIIMDKVAQEIFPIHQRRMKVFECKQKSDSKTFLREIIESIKMAEWKTFNEQSAAYHIFMQFTKSEEARKACFKILTDNPGGCTKTLMEKLAEIDAFPTDGRGPGSHIKAVKTDQPLGERKVCKDCKRVGHSTADCWGKCSFCGRFGHKSEVCRTKMRSDQAEALKKQI